MHRTLSVASSPVRDLLALTSRPEVISFAGGLPAPELFDLDGVRAAYDRALRDRAVLQYAPTEGDPALRDLVSSRLTGRGLPTSDVLITTGSQQALALVATAMLGPGAVVAVEEPTYLAALQCFRMTGARIVPVESDADGLVPSSLRSVVATEKPGLLYLVPTFANPTGRTLSAERRVEIAEIAAAHDLWIVEDDPYGELRYRGSAVPPLASMSDRTIYLGSFSKVGAPGMRLGWLRAPADLLRTLTIVKQAADLHTSTVDQAAAAVYLADNDLDAHITRLCAEYGARRDAMLAALPATTPAGTTWSDPDGGMFVWLRLPGDADSAVLLKDALQHDVAFVPGAAFFATTPDHATLRLSFTANTVEEIGEGMARLAKVLL
ncbi:PLP-dependent aminotransferase family protein [Lentzea flaviverrucosa]|uniref:2-aminoadipate transaminase n=1 Tax=Lentzea flaviverrucosa TaxID=200379 RepID=A0A1H9V2S3_9PSEU|nr:PLP-dependent aminotransferase family protein [Lentzea flaviverrucosa]RDI27577.1 2-aminoadipate transaminase [Lentzea flaviverrucosa]SES15869.1 2-aminoadipate transaminase [Lentzea flaviverrucosa]